MIVFENNQYICRCNDPTLWDRIGGMTGKWRMNQYDELEIEMWYYWELEKFIFWKEQHTSNYWVSEYNFNFLEKEVWSEYECTKNSQ